MAIDNILQALEEQCRSECQAIFDKAKSEVDEILAEAEAEAAKIREAKMDRVKKEVASERAALMYSSRLDFKNAMIRAREEIVNKAFEQATEKLATVRVNGSYQAILAKLVEEGLKKVSGDPVLHVDEKDAAVASKSLNSLNVRGEIRPDITCLGGCVIADAEERVTIINTLEERLERAKSRLRMEVAEELFTSG